MSKATDILTEEHRLIERALDFVRNFADRCHHHKEEDLLFTSLTKHGLPR